MQNLGKSAKCLKSKLEGKRSGDRSQNLKRRVARGGFYWTPLLFHQLGREALQVPAQDGTSSNQIKVLK